MALRILHLSSSGDTKPHEVREIGEDSSTGWHLHHCHRAALFVRKAYGRLPIERERDGKCSQSSVHIYLRCFAKVVSRNAEMNRPGQTSLHWSLRPPNGAQGDSVRVVCVVRPVRSFCQHIRQLHGMKEGYAERA